MRGVWNCCKWVFWRQPLGFAIPFGLLFAVWLFFGFGLLFLGLRRSYQHLVGQGLRTDCLGGGIGRLFSAKCLYVFPLELIYAFAVLALFIIGLFLTYNIAVQVNLFIISRWTPHQDRFSSVSPRKPTPPNRNGNVLSEIGRIGIVLAGGGAKGAFQAGAMKAIYRFLSEQDALEKVKVISGTSIGSWNALFWLADLMTPHIESAQEKAADTKRTGSVQSNTSEENSRNSHLNDDGDEFWRDQSIHEQWWQSINPKSLIAPSWYLPFVRNAFLSSEPWQSDFGQIFGQQRVSDRLRRNNITFYMTRCNVRTGELECATNNQTPPKINRMRYDVLDPQKHNFIERIKTAVFASMDLPPLFLYFSDEGDLFEDGGVIDNLPISFATHPDENCDLIFVLPLNADFEEEPNETSIIARLNRIMDMRQGALERQEFKLLYLYAEIAKLRNEYLKLGGVSPRVGEINRLPPAERAKARRHGSPKVFAICPQKSFTQGTINTRDIWNSPGARVAFREMYKATWRLLKEFDFGQEQSTVRVALVSRGGIVNWDERF